MDETARRVNACIIAVDRPGMGLSDFKPGRQYLDWPDDVTELADALGVSSGGPHAAACAFKILERLRVVAIVSSPCPFTVPVASESMSAFWRLRASVRRREPPLGWLGCSLRRYLVMRAVTQLALSCEHFGNCLSQAEWHLLDLA